MTRIAPLAVLALMFACNGADDQLDGLNPDRVARTVTSADGDMGVVVDGHNAFTWDLYAGLVEEKPGDNMFFSPFSITAALGMTRAGARGETAEQLRTAMHVDGEDDAWHTALGALTRDLNGSFDRGYTLRIANRLFGQEGYPFEPDFIATCNEDYGAPMEEVDFMVDPDGARERVNAWVEEQTEERIKDLLPEGSVDNDTRLVLANAIYFYADWARAFKVEDTQQADFTRLDGSTVQVPIMQMDLREVEEGHGIEAGWRDGVATLRLPYQDDEVSMVVLIPDDSAGLSALEAELSQELFDHHLAGVALHDGPIGLPKMRIDDKRDLVPLLKDLGIIDAFEWGTADFTGIADDDLYVTGVFHQSFVMVDEEGTEAAAGTGVVVGRESAPMPVIADKPFLFSIRDDLTGALLFVGRVIDPS